MVSDSRHPCHSRRTQTQKTLSAVLRMDLRRRRLSTESC